MKVKSPPQPADATLEESLQSGYTLPAEWYTDPAIFAREHNRIFRHTWQYVGLTEQLPNPGDFLTTTSRRRPHGPTSRSRWPDARPFANVCRHRGSQLVLDE